MSARSEKSNREAFRRRNLQGFCGNVRAEMSTFLGLETDFRDSGIGAGNGLAERGGDAGDSEHAPPICEVLLAIQCSACVIDGDAGDSSGFAQTADGCAFLVGSWVAGLS